MAAILPTVIDAAYVDGFRIRVTFSDGVKSVVDFSEWLNGAGADIAPETLHERAKASKAV